MPKRGKMFAGITRQVVISDETHQLLCEVAQHDNKYIGELADEILRRVLTRRQGESQRTNGMGHPHPLPHATGTP
jgi:predicted phage-related endonuclease